MSGLWVAVPAGADDLGRPGGDHDEAPDPRGGDVHLAANPAHFWNRIGNNSRRAGLHTPRESVGQLANPDFAGHSTATSHNSSSVNSEPVDLPGCGRVAAVPRWSGLINPSPHTSRAYDWRPTHTRAVDDGSDSCDVRSRGQGSSVSPQWSHSVVWTTTQRCRSRQPSA